MSLGTKSKEVIPILCGSATANIGVDGLLDYLVFCMPSAKDVSVKVKNQKTDEEVEITSDNQNLVALVYKTMADPYVGKLTLFRVYSGTLKSDSVVFNSSTGKEERVGQLFVTKGKEQIAVSEIGPGDLGAVASSRYSTNDTFSSKAFDYCSRNRILPMMSMAVEPKAKGDEDKIGSELQRLAEEDQLSVLKRMQRQGKRYLW